MLPSSSERRKPDIQNTLNNDLAEQTPEHNEARGLFRGEVARQLKHGIAILV